MAAAAVMIPTVIGAVIGFIAGKISGLPLRLPFHRRWSCGGCDDHWCDLLQSDPGGVVHRHRSWSRLLHPGDLHQLQPFYGGFEQRYALILDAVLKARPIVMAALAAGILLTGFAFTRIPGGFVPIEDQGYAIGFVQAPDGVSNEKTLAINRQVAEVLRSEEDIASAALFSGASLDGNAPNKGCSSSG